MCVEKQLFYAKNTMFEKEKPITEKSYDMKHDMIRDIKHVT